MKHNESQHYIELAWPLLWRILYCEHFGIKYFLLRSFGCALRVCSDRLPDGGNERNLNNIAIQREASLITFDIYQREKNSVVESMP